MVRAQHLGGGDFVGLQGAVVNPEFIQHKIRIRVLPKSDLPR
jgi:hypothetical protein